MFVTPDINVIFTNAKDNPALTFDDEWVKSTFIITEQDISTGNINPYEKFIRSNRYASSADHKFASTSPGMSLGVNPKPQFTRYCDVRSKGRLTNRPDVIAANVVSSTGLGMGGYYSTAIDDNQQRIFFRFGVPTYMPLPIWIARSFDVNKAVLQARGTITTEFLAAVSVATHFFAFLANPLMSLAMVVVKVLTSNSRFYSVRPTMYIYWATVEHLLNALVTRRTMLPHILKDYAYKLEGVVGTPEAVSAQFIADISAYVPDIIDPKTGRISVFALALRNQAAYNKIKLQEMRANVSKSISSANPSDDIGAKSDPVVTANLPLSRTSNTNITFVNNLFKSASDFLLGDTGSDEVNGLDDKSTGTATMVGYNPIYTDANGKPLAITLNKDDPKDTLDSQLESNVNAKAGKLAKYGEYLLAELSEGAAFAVFNVESTGSVGESFSSSFGSNPIEGTFNSFSAKSRSLGSLASAVDIPIIGDAIKLAADSAAVIISGATYGFANPLLALAYGVNVSMPKVWESSSASLPKASYKIRLVSPYGNAYSQLFNIYMPLSMILAASLPRATGSSSYVSPFFCEMYDRGRTNIQLGMVDSVGITRGTSNLAFTRAGHPNAIDVELSVANLDEVVALDVSPLGPISKAIAALTPDFSETPFTAYMNTIAAVDVYTQVYRVPQMRLKLAERYMNLKAVMNPDPAAYAALTVETIPGLGLIRNVLGDPASVLQSLNTY